MADLRRKLLLFLGALGGLFVAVIGSGLLYLTFGDLSRFQPRIETFVSEALGRDFRIGGNFELEVLPRISLIAEEVTLANAEWASAEPMLSIGQAAIDVDLWSVISGPVIVERVDLVDTRILLETDGTGRSNTSFDDSEPDAADESETETGAAGVPVIVEQATINALEIVSRQPGADDFNAVIESLAAAIVDDGALNVQLSGRVQEQAMTFDASIDPASSLQTGSGISYRIDATVEGAGFAVTGDIDALFPVATANGAGGQRIGFDASIASLELMGAAFDVQNLPEEVLSVAGNLLMQPSAIAVDPLAVALGDSDFAGSARVEFGEALAIEIDGESRLIDVTPFLPAVDPESDGSATATLEPAETVGEQSAATSEFVFPDEPLPFDLLDAVNLTVNLAVGEFRSRDLSVLDLQLAVLNSAGQASLETSFAGEQTGAAEVSIALDASSGTGNLDIAAELREITLNLASGDLDDPSQIPPIDISLDLTATGSTPHELAAGANGPVTVTVGAGLIENGAVGLVSGDIIAQLFSALNPLAEEEVFSTLDCAVVALNITDGVAVLDPVLVQTEKIQIIGGGDIELDTESVNVEFNTKPRAGVGITADMFVTPFVRLTGTLANPGIGLNARGALLQGGAAVLTGGMTLLLGGLADRATAEASQCEAALASVGNPDGADSR